MTKSSRINDFFRNEKERAPRGLIGAVPALVYYGVPLVASGCPYAFALTQSTSSLTWANAKQTTVSAAP